MRAGKIIFSFLSLIIVSSLVYAADVDVGDDIDFEYRFYGRKDTFEYSEFRQRIRLYLNGYLDNGIEIAATLHSAGVMNSTRTVVTYDGADINNLTPYFEHAYIKINDYYGYPLDISLGKLPINWVEGILISDRQLGLPALMLQAKALYDIDLEAYHCRTRDEILDISGIQGTGARAVKDWGIRRLELDYTYEKYLGTADTKRKIYGAYFRRKLHKGLEYSAFGYIMKGKKAQESFSGRALGAYGKFEGVVDPIGKGGAWIRYILGSGDYEDDEKGFLPILGSVEASLIGDYYGRNREFRLVDNIVSSEKTLSHSIANLSLMRNAVYANFKDIVWLYMIRSTYKTEATQQPIGGSLSWGARYSYRGVEVELRYTTFMPEPEYNRYDTDKETRLITAAVSSRF
jgi:hypothetical protein